MIKNATIIKHVRSVLDIPNIKCKELIDKNYSNNKLFKIIHSENNGQGHARNLGLEIATGEFIYFFDSDDIVTPNLFEEFHTKFNDGLGRYEKNIE